MPKGKKYKSSKNVTAELIDEKGHRWTVSLRLIGPKEKKGEVTVTHDPEKGLCNAGDVWYFKLKR